MFYSDARFVGFDSDGDTLNAEVLKQHIFGQHVAGYMKNLQETNEEVYKTQFNRYIQDGIGHDQVYLVMIIIIVINDYVNRLLKFIKMHMQRFVKIHHTQRK